MYGQEGSILLLIGIFGTTAPMGLERVSWIGSVPMARTIYRSTEIFSMP